MNVEEQISILHNDTEVEIHYEGGTSYLCDGEDLKRLVHEKRSLESQMRLILHQLEHYENETSIGWVKFMLQAGLDELRTDIQDWKVK